MKAIDTEWKISTLFSSPPHSVSEIPLYPPLIPSQIEPCIFLRRVAYEMRVFATTRKTNKVEDIDNV